MTRHAHLWFFFGVLLVGGTCGVVGVVMVLASEMKGGERFWLFLGLEVFVGVVSGWAVRPWARWRAQLHQRVSRELPCERKKFLRLGRRRDVCRMAM
jgi:hypothetical protein